VTIGDGDDDKYGYGDSGENIVTIVIIVTVSFDGDAREPFSKGAPCRGAIRR